MQKLHRKQSAMAFEYIANGQYVLTAATSSLQQINNKQKLSSCDIFSFFFCISITNVKFK